MGRAVGLAAVGESSQMQEETQEDRVVQNVMQPQILSGGVNMRLPLLHLGLYGMFCSGRLSQRE